MLPPPDAPPPPSSDDAQRQDKSQAAGELFGTVYEELRSIADILARRERSSSLHATALVNEAYLALCQRDPGLSYARDHFLRTAARVMRHLLIDHKRSRATRERHTGGPLPVFDEIVDRYESHVGDLLVVEEALQRIAEDDPETVRLIDLRFFAGLSLTECAQAMDVSVRTVSRWWQLAKAQLMRELRP